MKILAWLLALALPIQNLAVVALDLRGPAHFHVDADSARPGQHRHSHEDIERHFHGADRSAIAVDDDDHHHDADALESNKRASLNAFDTLTAPASPPAVDHPGAGAVSGAGIRSAPPPFPGRLERPPSPSAARLFS